MIGEIEKEFLEKKLIKEGHELLCDLVNDKNLLSEYIKKYNKNLNVQAIIDFLEENFAEYLDGFFQGEAVNYYNNPNQLNII